MKLQKEKPLPLFACLAETFLTTGVVGKDES